MSHYAQYHGDLESVWRINTGPVMMYGQDVIDGYKKMIKDANEENTLLRAEIATLKNQVRQLKNRPEKRTNSL